MPVDSEKLYSDLIYTRTYSRWLQDKQRRETWEETVNRYSEFFINRIPKKYNDDFLEVIKLIKNKEVMPSMRALWSAGLALEKDNIAGYNCSFLYIDSIKSFSEMLYILMCGTGVGFSVERQYINKLPTIPNKLEEVDYTIVVADSKLGWAKGLHDLLKFLYKGKIPKYDLSKLRPKGAVLKVFGGRASGPEPLKQLFEFIKKVFKEAVNRKLNSVECYDICCYIMSVVVSGGVRRSAGISLSNLSDDRMAKAKFGEFWMTDPQRQMCNNSVAYTEKPEPARFLTEWLSLMNSRTGERGLFNREGAKFNAARSGRRDPNYEFGTNPCGEVLIRGNQFCNLSEVIIKPHDTFDTLKVKVKAATILGCIQSTLTDFNYLRRIWKNNCEEERLLGVSLTGLLDHPILNKISKKSKGWLHSLKEEAIETASDWSKILGINMPTAITVVKPSGTVSQLVGCSSGIHPRYSQYYIRRVRIDSFDPLAKLLMDNGFEAKPDTGQTMENANTLVFEFPIKSPISSVVKDDITAIQQLEYWKTVRNYWCEHNPSVTIYIKEEEWIEVGAWVYKNWNYICGLSFLPYDTGLYQLAPYEEIDEEVYLQMVEDLPDIDFTKLSEYEKDDYTEGSMEYACVAGSCEI